MATTLIHDELTLAYPEGFGVMGPDEMQSLYQDDHPDRWGIWDKERHVIFTVWWHDSNKFVSALASTKSLIERVEKIHARKLKGHAYRSTGHYALEVAGHEARGFSYEYRVQDVDQAADIMVFKHGACCYTLYFYARKDTYERDRHLLDDFLESISFA